MRGYIAVTDPGWYEHLARTPGPKDANFWRPSTRAVRLPTGTPFLFKLKAPHHAIAGFGYFAGFSILPDWLAWETFAEANGVVSLAAFRDRLGRIQRGARIEADAIGRIGACLVAEARFFEERDWVKPPQTWSPRTQTGAGWDLAEGEGARIWAECLARATTPPLIVRDKGPRFGTPALRVPRLGQPIFRVSVLDAYDRACAVTGEHSLPVLEAAHIVPYADGGEHAVSNGLSLRSDLHRLFDRGYVTISADHTFVVSARLRQDFDNGRSYYGLQDRPVFQPTHAARPSPEALRWHREERFLG